LFQIFAIAVRETIAKDNSGELTRKARVTFVLPGFIGEARRTSFCVQGILMKLKEGAIGAESSLTKDLLSIVYFIASA
jgi:hypothetical protein